MKINNNISTKPQVWLWVLLLVVLSCEKDDICAEANITPFLVIDFVDLDDTTTLDDVDDLQVRYLASGVGADTLDIDVLDFQADLETISLSLPVDRNEVTYRFYQNFDEVTVTDDDGEPLDEVEISDDTEFDTFRFTYEVSNEYVSRACGFKSTYSNLRLERLADFENEPLRPFVVDVITDSSNITDEEEAHLRFSH